MTQNEHYFSGCQPKMVICQIVYFAYRWLITSMSSEKTSINANVLPPLVTHEKIEEVSSSGRVDINILLNRARKVQKKETRANLVFGGLIVCLILVVGLILSF